MCKVSISDLIIKAVGADNEEKPQPEQKLEGRYNCTTGKVDVQTMPAAPVEEDRQTMGGGSAERDDAAELTRVVRDTLFQPPDSGTPAHPLAQLVMAPGFDQCVKHGDMVTLAASYATYGIPVFPCWYGAGGKAPMTPHGLYDAEQDKEAVAALWKKQPKACPGLPQGHRQIVRAGIKDAAILNELHDQGDGSRYDKGPKTGRLKVLDAERLLLWARTCPTVAIDIDRPKKAEDADGLDTLTAWVREHGPLPATLVVMTPGYVVDGTRRHGLHIYYQETPETRRLLNAVKPEALKGVDVRATGGYVMAPGGVRKDGCAYVPILKADIAEMPEDLLAMLPKDDDTQSRLAGAPLLAMAAAGPKVADGHPQPKSVAPVTALPAEVTEGTPIYVNGKPIAANKPRPLPAGCEIFRGYQKMRSQDEGPRLCLRGPGRDTGWGRKMLDWICNGNPADRTPNSIRQLTAGERNTKGSGYILHAYNLVSGGWITQSTMETEVTAALEALFQGERDPITLMRGATANKGMLNGYGPKPDAGGIRIWCAEMGVPEPSWVAEDLAAKETVKATRGADDGQQAVPWRKDGPTPEEERCRKLKSKIAAVLKHSRPVEEGDAATGLHPLLTKLGDWGVTDFGGLLLNEYQGRKRIVVKVYGAEGDTPEGAEREPRTLFCIWEDADFGASVGGVKIADTYADLSTGDKVEECDICACADLASAVALRGIVGDQFRVVFLPARRSLKDAGAALRSQFPRARICFCSGDEPGDIQRARAGAAHCDGRHAVLPDFKTSDLTPSGNVVTVSGIDRQPAFVDAILKALEEEAAPSDRPLITLDPDEDAAIMDQIGDLLGEAQTVFKRYGMLAQIVNVERKHADTGAVTTKPAIKFLNQHSLRGAVTGIARFQKLDVRTDGMKRATPPDALLQTFLSTPEHWQRIPILSSVVDVPTIRSSGEIIAEHGLHESSGLFCTFQRQDFPEVEEAPSREAAMAALKYLKEEVLEGFPFVDGPSESAALAALLTIPVRPILDHIPMFGFTAPTPGTGKSALCDIVAITCTGRTATTISVSKSDEELTKALTAYLLAGDPVLLLDNVSRIFNLDKLCSILTQEEITDRLLGTHEQVTAYPESIWLISGNNLTIVGDMTRRVIMCALDAKVEHPSQRVFARNLYSWLRTNRPRIVLAALTVLRAHIRAGFPGAHGMRPLLGFEKWSVMVRGALLWLGAADPLLTQEQIEYVDPVREQRLKLLEAWHGAFGHDIKTSRELVSLVREEGSSMFQDNSPAGQARETLANCIRDLCGHGGVTERVLGNKLRGLIGVITDGYTLTKKMREGAAKVTGWIVTKKSEEETPPL